MMHRRVPANKNKAQSTKHRRIKDRDKQIGDDGTGGKLMILYLKW
jgi:hypothetical protein